MHERWQPTTEPFSPAPQTDAFASFAWSQECLWIGNLIDFTWSIQSPTPETETEYIPSDLDDLNVNLFSPISSIVMNEMMHDDFGTGEIIRQIPDLQEIKHGIHLYIMEYLMGYPGFIYVIKTFLVYKCLIFLLKLNGKPRQETWLYQDKSFIWKKLRKIPSLVPVFEFSDTCFRINEVYVAVET